MEIYVVFGLPGAGKTFVGEIMQKYFDFFHYDGDQDMPEKLKTAIKKQELITDDLRDEFFNKLIASIKLLKTKYKKIVISQTFIKEKYRNKFLKQIPEIKFILVQTDTIIREKRLLQNKVFQLDIEYWRKMCAIFEEPKVDYTIIYNDHDGEENVKEQLHQIILTSSLPAMLRKALQAG